MDDSCVEEHGDDETEPLVWLWLLTQTQGTVDYGIREGVLEATETTELTQGTDLDVEIGCIRTSPKDLYITVLDASDIVHTGNVSGSHVDENPR